jgi:hypothetical protein
VRTPQCSLAIHNSTFPRLGAQAYYLRCISHDHWLQLLAASALPSPHDERIFSPGGTQPCQYLVRKSPAT